VNAELDDLLEIERQCDLALGIVFLVSIASAYHCLAQILVLFHKDT